MWLHQRTHSTEFHRSHTISFTPTEHLPSAYFFPCFCRYFIENYHSFNPK
ncbi:hypothetical protein FTUN_1417 [Frigoriglobus tundricola]|uniref:Uncharacterized protein n=1 Tax=Frigoriglobus tundricola TaxID=2774151 RepID=A0A6M5YKU5_9BACT|nr:hypothetical protein FTUN_1417 [Frigoriglobus tundricola]